MDHLLSGAFAGFFATTLLHPLDLIKTRLHVQGSANAPLAKSPMRLPHYNGLLDACHTILKLEGWLGFYQGLTPNVVGNTASWAVYMYFYNRSKELLRQSGMHDSRLYLTAATAAGAVTTLMLHPIFTIKTRLQLQLHVSEANARLALPHGLLPAAQRDNYAGTANAIQRIVAEEGVLSLYRGLGPSMLLVSHGSIQFLAYEHAKVRLAGYRCVETAHTTADGNRSQISEADSTRGDTNVPHNGGKSSCSQTSGPHLLAYDLLLASVGSKICATLATYPYQVIRSCMQQRTVVGSDSILYRTTSETVADIWRADGAAGFYRGIWPHILRSTPQATITLIIYEYCQRALTWNQSE